MTGLGLWQRWLPSSPLPPGRPEGRERSEPLAPQRSPAGAHGWDAAPRFSEAGRPLGTQEKHLSAEATRTQASQAGAGDSPRKRRCCQVSLPRQPHPCRGREGGRGGAPRGTRCVVGAAIRKQTLQARGGAEREGGCRLAQQTITRTGWVSIPEPGEGQGRRRGGHSCPKCPRPEELPKGWELCSEMKKSPGDQLQAKPHPLKGGGPSGPRGRSRDPGPGSCPLGARK